MDARVLEIAAERKVARRFQNELRIHLRGLRRRAGDGERARLGEQQVAAGRVRLSTAPLDGRHDGRGVFAGLEFLQLRERHPAAVGHVPEVEATEVGDDLVPADVDAAVVGILLLLAPLVEAVAILALHAEVGFDLPLAVDQPRPQHAVLRDVHLAPR